MQEVKKKLPNNYYRRRDSYQYPAGHWIRPDIGYIPSSWTDTSWTTEIGGVQPVLEEPGTDGPGSDIPGNVDPRYIDGISSIHILNRYILRHVVE